MLVQQWPECAGRKSQWTSSDIQLLKEQRLFFNPVDRLNKFSAAVKALDNWNNKTSCRPNDRFPFDGLNKEPHAAAVLVDRIQSKIVQQIQNEIQTQKNIIDNTILCTEENVPANLENKCAAFINELLPELQTRLQTMRALKSIADNNDKPLAHDQAFTTDLYQTLYPSVWKKDSQKKLSPLTPEELKTQSEFAAKFKQQADKINASPESDDKVTPMDLASEAYYSMLSTTPVLLFFDKKITKQNLNDAFKKLKLQNTFDQNEMLQNPPQDLFMMADYVQCAIKDLPEDQKGDACFVTSQIYKNLHIQYEIFPVYAAMMVGVLSLSASPLKFTIMKKRFSVLEGSMKKFALSGSAVYGTMNHKTWQKYNRGVNFCSTQALVDDVTRSKICPFRSLDSAYKNLQTGAVIGTGLSLGIGSVAILRAVKGFIGGK